jgi:hypothetical protein
MKRILITIALCAAMITVVWAGNGFKSHFDGEWDVEITNGCNGTVVTYEDSKIVAENSVSISFIPGNSRKIRTIRTDGTCMSVSLVESD